MRSIGDDLSKDSLTCGSLLKAAVNAPIGPRLGFAIQTMNQGSNPLTKKTLKKIPQIKNQRRHFFSIVDKTSALTTALSKLETTSKMQSPKMLKMMVKMFIVFV